MKNSQFFTIVGMFLLVLSTQEVVLKPILVSGGILTICSLLYYGFIEEMK